MIIETSYLCNFVNYSDRQSVFTCEFYSRPGLANNNNNAQTITNCGKEGLDSFAIIIKVPVAVAVAVQVEAAAWQINELNAE